MQEARRIEEDQPFPQNTFTVLVVDDDEQFRKSYTRALNLIRVACVDAHLHAISAANAREASETLESTKVDCCVIDYQMPGANGLQLQREILDNYPDMAIILLTGEGNEELAAAAIKEGAMDYIVKGAISMEQIESSIVHSVNRVRLARALEMQRKQLVEAERQRVMLQSLGTACHHMSQPLTVLRSAIVMLKRAEKDPAQREMLVAAFNACEDMCEIIWKIGSTSSYKTEPYLEPGEKHPDDGSGDLIKL